MLLHMIEQYKQKHKEMRKDSKCNGRDAAIGSGGSGGSKSGRIICTWLTSQGLMDQSDLAIDLQFTNDHIAMRTRVGYWTWAYL